MKLTEVASVVIALILAAALAHLMDDPGRTWIGMIFDHPEVESAQEAPRSAPASDAFFAGWNFLAYGFSLAALFFFRKVTGGRFSPRYAGTALTGASVLILLFYCWMLAPSSASHGGLGNQTGLAILWMPLAVPVSCLAIAAACRLGTRIAPAGRPPRGT